MVIARTSLGQRGPAGCAKRLEFAAPWGGLELCRGSADSASHLSGGVLFGARFGNIGARVEVHGAGRVHLHASVDVTRFCCARAEQQGTQITG
eukprot:7477590-Heterocapsa_arctica.AAC.1